MVRVLLLRLLGVALVVLLTAVVAFGAIHLLRGQEAWHATLADLHRTFVKRRPPGRALWELGWPVDVTLLVFGLGVAPWLGLRIGSWAVGRGESLVIVTLNAVCSLLLTVQPYFAGFVVLLCFDGAFGLLPLPGFFPADSTQITVAEPLTFARVLLGPALLVMLPGFAACYRLTLATAKDEAGEDYIRTALAKGVPPRRAIARDTRPAARVAVLSFIGGAVPFFVFNLTLLEYVFNVPGFFKAVATASGLAGSHGATLEAEVNYPVIQAAALWAALLIAVVSALADVVIYRLDPRVRGPSA